MPSAEHHPRYCFLLGSAVKCADDFKFQRVEVLSRSSSSLEGKGLGAAGQMPFTPATWSTYEVDGEVGIDITDLEDSLPPEAN